jgi:hypothetical protein
MGRVSGGAVRSTSTEKESSMIIEKPIRRMEMILSKRRRAIRPGRKRFLGTLPKVEIERRCLALARDMKVTL